ncbi:hypothetical protein F5Y04DRAFT_92047 [Hypomontagnella monticulosa]|nr:hypothetical protein F5Y04DRAFT_92047 [Hypomontagnella monticulosa]
MVYDVLRGAILDPLCYILIYIYRSCIYIITVPLPTIISGLTQLLLLVIPLMIKTCGWIIIGFSHAVLCVLSFFSRLFLRLILLPIRVALSPFLALSRLIGWFWRLSSFVLGLAKWCLSILFSTSTVRWTIVLCIAVFVGGELYRWGYAHGQQSKFRNHYTNYGAAGGGSYPGSSQSKSNNENYHAGDDGNEAKRRDVPKREAATSLQELSDAFKLWMEKVKAATADKTKTHSIPQPLPTRCDDVSCKARREELDVTFCRHSLGTLVNAYVKVNMLSAEAKRGLLDRQRKTLHPDRFTRCPGEYKARIQQVAQELVKAIHELM